MSWFWWFFLFLLLLLVVLAALLYVTRRRWLAAFVRLPKAQYATAVERALPVPMHDGAILLADHYYPKAPGSFPTVLIRSPWGRGWEKMPLSLAYLFVAGRFAERGYHVIVHSTRNRPDERLAFYPDHEGDDGLAVIGAPEMTLYAHASPAGADFFLRLCVVDGNGRSTNVCDGFVRVENFAARPGEDPTLVQITLEPTAWQFRRGERLRLLIAGGAHPRWNRNLGAGGWNFDSSSLAATEQTVYYGPQHPSVLRLPVVAQSTIEDKEQPYGA